MTVVMQGMHHMAPATPANDFGKGHPVTQGWNNRSYSREEYPNLCTDRPQRPNAQYAHDRQPALYNANRKQ